MFSLVRPCVRKLVFTNTAMISTAIWQQLEKVDMTKIGLTGEKASKQADKKLPQRVHQ